MTKVIVLENQEVFMKFIIFSLGVILMASASAKSIYDFKLPAAKGGEINLSEYKDKNIIITNIATHCGYTPQLNDLEKLSEREDTVVIGIPSNEFGGQTPGSEKEIVEFCKAKYGADFPLSTKSLVRGENRIPLIAYLQEKTDQAEISWNFEKYLITPGAKTLKHFKSKDLKEIEEFLSK